jgi:hypothetical protein
LDEKIPTFDTWSRVSGKETRADYRSWRFWGVADRRGREHNRRMERGKGFFGRSRSEAEHRRVPARTYYDFEA